MTACAVLVDQGRDLLSPCHGIRCRMNHSDLGDFVRHDQHDSKRCGEACDDLGCGDCVHRVRLSPELMMLQPMGSPVAVSTWPPLSTAFSACSAKCLVA